MDGASPTHEVLGEKRDIIENFPRGHLCYIPNNKLAVFCLRPENLAVF